PLYYALAVVVAASRLHVKIHHASDVVGGAIIGAALGEIVRRTVPMEVSAPAGAGPQESLDPEAG
ncbi:MAG: phosphatase PAP2 family protein, partial [Actinomycetota bacterium]|nr:phosphatase PAP2 family protein [Actinomycetota bacterium]